MSHPKSRPLCAAMALVLMLGLAGCGKDAASSSDALSRVYASSVSAGSASGSGSLASSADAASSLASAAQVPPAGTAVVEAGTFELLDTEGRFTPERAPYLVLNDDGTATFRLNSGEALGMASGPYSVQGQRLTLTIETLEIDVAFAGRQLGTLPFEVLSADHLRYDGDAYGLTLKGNIFTRQGAAPYSPDTTPPAVIRPDTPASSPSDVSADGSGSTSALSGASGSDASIASGEETSSQAASQDASAVDEDNIPAILPGRTPPETMKQGDAFRLVDLYQLDEVEYDPAYFAARPGADGTSLILTALAPGETTIAYASMPEDDYDPVTELHTIIIEEKGFGLLFLLAVAGGSVLLGGLITFVLLMVLKKGKKKKGAAVDDEDEDGEASEGEAPLDKKQKKALKAAKRKEAKAAKLAQKREKAAAKAEKKAEKAKQAAEAAAEKAAAAAADIEAAAQAAPAAPPSEEAPAPAATPDDDDDDDVPTPPGSQVVL